MPRTRKIVTLLTLAVAIGVASSSTPAAAHGGEGQMDITALTRDGDQVTVTTFLTFAGDGHGVPNATVTLVVGEGTPVPMTGGPEDGTYTATVAAAPGDTIRITSVEPVVTIEVTAPEATATTTVPPTTQAASTTGATTTTAAEPTSTTAGPVTSDVATATTSSDDGGTNMALVGGLIGLVVLAAAGAAVVVLRKPAADGDA